MNQTQKEIWKDIPGYEGLYQASNLGRIRALGRYYKVYRSSLKKNIEIYRRPHIMKPHIKKSTGYCGTTLVDGKHIQHHVYVHRMVAMAFLPNPDNCEEVNHKNWNTSDNRVENLEWVTHDDNVRKQ